MVIFSDEASIIVFAKRGMQNISRFSDKRERYNNYSEAMFWGCFTYDHKGPCHIYYPETKEQKLANEAKMDTLNGEEIEEECRELFDEQERAKEAEWDRKGKKWPTIRASWELFWKNNKFKKTAARGGVDNLRYTYEVLEPHLIPYYDEIMLQRHDPDEFECDQPP
jgi:hypothetical protein